MGSSELSDGVCWLEVAGWGIDLGSAAAGSASGRSEAARPRGRRRARGHTSHDRRGEGQGAEGEAGAVCAVRVPRGRAPHFEFIFRFPIDFHLRPALAAPRAMHMLHTQHRQAIHKRWLWKARLSGVQDAEFVYPCHFSRHGRSLAPWFERHAPEARTL